jgi:PAS domain S-box-containing protein
MTFAGSDPEKIRSQNSDEAEQCRKTAIICGAVVFLLGLLGISGLLFNIPLLTSIMPGYKPMSFVAGLAWLFFGGFIILFTETSRTDCARAGIAWALGVAAIAGALELPLNILGKHFIAENLFLQAGDLVAGQPTTHISPVATLVIILTAITLFVLLYAPETDTGTPLARNSAGTGGLMILLIGFTYFLSYLYGTPLFRGTTTIMVSPVSVLAIGVTGIGLMALAGPDAIPLRYFIGTGTRALLLRMFIPLTLAIILFQNLLQETLFSWVQLPDAVITAVSFVLFSVLAMYSVGRIASRVSRTIDKAEQERKIAEERLMASEAHLQFARKAATAGTWEWDLTTNENTWSDELWKLYGREPGCCTPTYDLWRETIHPEDRAKAEEAVRVASGTGTELNTEWRVNLQNGPERWLMSRGRPVRNSSGTVIRYVGIVIDITTRKKAEKALRESEEKYRAVVEDQEEFICRFNPDGTHIFVNEAYCRYFGMSRERLLGQKFRPRIHPEDAERVRLFFSTLSPDNPVGDCEHRIIMPDGTVRWQRWSDRAIFDSRGTLTEIQSVGRDITAHKEAEAGLTESRQMLSDIIEFLPDATFVIDNDGKVITWNRAIEDLTGVKKEAVLGKGDHAYAVPVYGEVRHLLLDLIDADDPDLIRKYHNFRRVGKILYAETYSPMAGAGKGASVWLTAAPLLDSQGRKIGAIESIRDISEWKRTGAALSESEKRFRLLFDNMTEAFAVHEIICDAAGVPVDYRFLILNPAFEAMTGLKAADIIGKTVREIMPDIEFTWIERYGHVALSGEGIVFDDYNASTRRHYQVMAYCPTKGQFACIFTDVTETRVAEQQRTALIGELEEKNAELERFTYTVSHDLKSPIITINGFLGKLEEDATGGNIPMVKRDIQRISSATAKMDELLSDLLNLSRIGRIINPPRAVPLEMLAREAVELVHGKLTQRKIPVEIAPHLPVVLVDQTRIREVLVNLIENSIKFMGEQEAPQITIGSETEDGHPVFFVRDNGIGIEPEFLDKVFGLFEKLDSRTEGTGVGLTIVRRIIEVHGGVIRAESPGANKGTTIYFTLPVTGSNCVYKPMKRTTSGIQKP